MIPDYATLTRLQPTTLIGVSAGELLRLLAAFHAAQDEQSHEDRATEQIAREVAERAR